MPNDGSTALTAEAVIRLLRMEPLAFEGGYYAETYRTGLVRKEHVPWSPDDDRSLKTAIYYLLTPDTKSAMHRLPGDEVFHHYLGDPVLQLQLYPDGSGEMMRIGGNLLAGERPQVLVSGGVWQGTLLAPAQHGFALLGTTMAPGFDHRDFELGEVAELARLYPDWAEAIRARLP